MLVVNICLAGNIVLMFLLFKTCKLCFLFQSLPWENSCLWTAFGLIHVAREQSPLGEVLLHGWSPVLQAWIQQLCYIQITQHSWFFGHQDTRSSVILPPSRSVLWCGKFYKGLTVINYNTSVTLTGNFNIVQLKMWFASVEHLWDGSRE